MEMCRRLASPPVASAPPPAPPPVASAPGGMQMVEVPLPPGHFPGMMLEITVSCSLTAALLELCVGFCSCAEHGDD